MTGPYNPPPQGPQWNQGPPPVTDAMISAELERQRRRNKRLLIGGGCVALVVIVGLVVAVVMLAASNSGSKSAGASRTYQTYTPPAAAETTTTRATAPSPTRPVRGLGEVITLTGDGTEILDYAVTSIEVDGDCTDSYVSEPKNGHLIVVTLDVQTTANYTEDYASLLDPQDFAIVGPDGVTETGNWTVSSYGCTNNQVPDGFSPSSKYTYKIALDSKNTSGTLRYEIGNASSSWTF